MRILHLLNQERLTICLVKEMTGTLKDIELGSLIQNIHGKFDSTGCANNYHDEDNTNFTRKPAMCVEINEATRDCFTTQGVAQNLEKENFKQSTRQDGNLFRCC
jgi:hypothetical protein